jgi:hypothetical protein
LEEQYAVVDTRPVLPGDQNFTVLAYIIPYDGKGAVIDQVTHYALDGTVRLLVYPPTAGVKSAQLPQLGAEQVSDNGDTYMSYGATLTLAGGSSVVYEISGGAAGLSAFTLLLIGTGICAVGAAALLYWRGRVVTLANSRNGQIDALAQQIAALDDAHNAGTLNHDLWHRQRAELKARLAELLEKPQD